MAPNVEVFPASELPRHLQIVQEGFKPKRRKGKPLDPFQCPLYEVKQYSCHPVSPRQIQCRTILRLFRKCANGVTIETTALDKEREKYKARESNP
ncbi:hypothetical protein VTO42DRAFT_145 [Malbranchea cinnamomea]